MNIGETHVPCYHAGAPWDPSYNPCVPFSDCNDAAECRRRQTACLEYVDRSLAPLLAVFRDASIELTAVPTLRVVGRACYDPPLKQEASV